MRMPTRPSKSIARTEKANGREIRSKKGFESGGEKIRCQNEAVIITGLGSQFDGTINEIAYPGFEVIVVQGAASVQPSAAALVLAGHEQAMVCAPAPPSLANLVLDLLADIVDDVGAIELERAHGPGVDELDAQGEDLRRHLGHHLCGDKIGRVRASTLPRAL